MNSRLHRRLAELTLLLTGAVLFQACGDGGSGDDSGPAQDRDNTPDYLTQAVDLSRFFRWTFPRGINDCRLFIEIDDRASSLPAGFDRTAARTRIEATRDAWKRAIIASGVPMESQTRFLSEAGTTPFPTSSAVIKIRFVDQLSGAVIGTTHPATTSNGRIDFIQIELAMRNSAGQVLDNSQALATALHEFGHALGIACIPLCGPSGGHSPNSGDIMFFAALPFTSLSGGDVRTVQHLYSLTPQVVREDA